MAFKLTVVLSRRNARVPAFQQHGLAGGPFSRAAVFIGATALIAAAVFVGAIGNVSSRGPAWLTGVTTSMAGRLTGQDDGGSSRGAQ